MAEKRQCPLCEEPLEDAHDVVLCEKTELLKGRETIKKLKASLREWVYGEGGWFFQRDLLGKMAWEHANCPHEIKPAQDPKPNPWLHPNEEFVQEGKLVYMRTVDGWKLVGASTSVDGGTAVMRLMNMGSK